MYVLKIVFHSIIVIIATNLWQYMCFFFSTIKIAVNNTIPISIRVVRRSTKKKNPRKGHTHYQVVT